MADAAADTGRGFIDVNAVFGPAHGTAGTAEAPLDLLVAERRSHGIRLSLASSLLAVWADGSTGNRLAVEAAADTANGLAASTQYCFSVWVQKDGYATRASTSLCDTTQAPPPHGYSKVAVYNCNYYGRSVAIWTWDATTGSGWQQQGQLAYQGDTFGRCPVSVGLTRSDGRFC